ncbi:MAG TPA: hypothetical protein VK423_06295 [Thermoplasmata archaeon]|nr:hypothetical protein [Thermoplasmata archaeon]
MGAAGRLIAIEGRSAAGKTTLVRAAARTFGWRPLAEAFDRLDPAPSLEYESSAELLLLEATLLAEEVRRYREARQACARGETVLADTWFLGPVTYTRGLVELGRAPASVGRTVERSARSLLQRGALGLPDLTVYLDTTPRERARRARADRQRHPAALFPRHEAVGEVERTYFEDSFPASLPDRFRTLRGRSDPPTLVGAVRRFVDALDLAPVTRTEGRTVLSLLRRPARDRRGRITVPNR